MKKYLIDYNTGAGNNFADSIEDAKQKADEGAAYTQKDIVIYEGKSNTPTSEWKEILRRNWWGVPFDPEETEETKEEIIQFGSFGYYGAWS